MLMHHYVLLSTVDIHASAFFATGLPPPPLRKGARGAARPGRPPSFDKASAISYTRFTMIGQFTAVYMKRGKWYVAYVEEIPGVNTQGRTLAKAKRNLREALAMVLEANRALAV